VAPPEPAASTADEPLALSLSIGDADTLPGADADVELDALALSPPPDPGPDAAGDPDLSYTLGGTPLGGDVRAGGGALILPGREASATASAGFARVRPADAAPATPPDGHEIAPIRDALPEPDADSEPDVVAPSVEPGSAAPLGARMLAGLVDIAVLAAVDAAVVLATLRATGVDIAQADRLPLAPLAVFLVLLAVGYLSMCTVLAGRTVGKAAFGLAVVEPGGRPVRLAPAVVRALIQVLTVPVAGLGFLPALLGADRRSLYDRLAGTDVVRDARAVQDTRPA
jgi:uncharacterized RDD family membrane protein YckC